jgi:epsilon-lactone hydrolase
VGKSIREAIFDHLRTVKQRAESALKRGDWNGYREAVGDYGAFRPECMTPVTEVHRVRVETMEAEWLIPSEPLDDARMVYVHGGAWMAGGLDSHRGLVSRIAEASGIPTLAIEYRLAPEHPFPAALEDCLSAYGWLLENGPNGSDPCGRAFLAGDSAGGNLALASLLALKELPDALPDAAVVLSPATDFTASGASVETRRAVDPVIDHSRTPGMQRLYCPGHRANEPLISPLFGDLAGLPPLLIQAGDAETLLDDSVLFAARAREAGVDVALEVWDEMPHVWQFFAPVLAESTAAIASIARFLRAHAE